MMNKEIKEDWLEALRSGDYEKGIGSLNENNKLCCLGVLCEVMKVDSIVVNGPHGTQWKLYRRSYVARGHKCYLPDEVALEAGIRNNPIEYKHRKHSALHHLIEINDSNETFDEVITFIEEYL